MSIGVGLLGVLVAVCFSVINLFLEWQKSRTIYWIKKAVAQLENPCTVIQEPYYVSRNNLELELRKAIDSMCENASRTYYVIIGSRGTGKTFYITIILT